MAKAVLFTIIGSALGRGWDFLTEKHIWRFYAVAGFIPFLPWLIGANAAYHSGHLHTSYVDLTIGLVFWLLYFATNA
jgi:hypothetical protein